MPFLRLLLPIVVGILFGKFISSSHYLYIVGLIGLVVILFSFFKPLKSYRKLRWLFGTGLMLFLFSIAIHSYKYRSDLVSYDFPVENSAFVGEVLDLPQPKKRSVACEIKLISPVNKKVLLYFAPDSLSKSLKPGDEIIVNTKINPFKNLGNPNEFDYSAYMKSKGFSGTAYIDSTKWIKTGEHKFSLKTEALLVRSYILDIYKSFGLDHDEFAFLSALTLGYKADLSNDLKQSFRASGTSHVLAVSGLHVGVVYIIIVLLLSFLGKRRKMFFIRQLIVLLVLWGYVFITGMPVSVIRAAFMLSLICIGNMFHKKGFSYNTLFAAAFFILIANPFYLFDVGFQLSFISVFSILFFQPKLSSLYKPKRKISTYVWGLATISLAAQLGVFPLALYYFGTFPTYFFITNLLIIPFIGVIIYLAVTITSLSFLTVLNIPVLTQIYKLIIIFMQFFIKGVLKIIYFFESLPMSLLQGYHISILQVILVFSIIYFFAFFVLRKKPRFLFLSLMSLEFILLIAVFSSLKQPVNYFFVYNNFSQIEMGYNINNNKIDLQELSNIVVAHPTKKIILLTENLFKYSTDNQAVPIDYLILSSDNSFSMHQLFPFFKPEKVIIDSSISRYAAKKITRECLKLNIPIHDISDLGAYSINF